MGGTISNNCNNLAKDIWKFCIKQKVWISSEHIPGSEIYITDFMSRSFNNNTVWQLSTELFQKIVEQFSVTPTIDLFASHLNKQLERYVSWNPDPYCYAVDAFNFSWKNEIIYAFLPFSMISRSISKIIKDQSTGIMIVPLWPTQNWFSLMMQVLIGHPAKLPATRKTLELPSNRQRLHHLLPKLRLLAVLLSGKPSEQQNFQMRLKKSFMIYKEPR